MSLWMSPWVLSSGCKGLAPAHAGCRCLAELAPAALQAPYYLCRLASHHATDCYRLGRPLQAHFAKGGKVPFVRGTTGWAGGLSEAKACECARALCL